MKPSYEIRLIEEADAASVLAIYRHYVENTIVSFEYETPTLQEYIERIKTNTSKYPWLVCLCDTKIIGYAYGSTHRSRTAYQWSPESTIYLAPDFHSKGIGSVLYETLFALLKIQGYYTVFAGVGLPNEKSISFHQAMGFEEIGRFKNVGYKLGNWHDTHWFQLMLNEYILEPTLPKKLEQLENKAIYELLAKANSKLENL